MAEEVKAVRKREMREDNDRKRRIERGDETVGLTSPQIVPRTTPQTVNNSDDMYGQSFFSAYQPSENDEEEAVVIYEEKADKKGMTQFF